MKKFKNTVLILGMISMTPIFVYFIFMFTEGNTVLSVDTQDWGAFGSFVGGFLSPMSALASILVVYFTFLEEYRESNRQKKLALIRENLSRIDEQLNAALEQEFYFPVMRQHYGGSIRKAIVNISEEKIATTNEMDEALLALLSDFAITADALRYYLVCLAEVPNDKPDHAFLCDLEQGYWVRKYSPIVGRMLKIVGENAFEAKVTETQLISFNYIFCRNKSVK